MNDKKEGHGIYEWPDGRKYDGTWADGKQHGVGTYIKADGTNKKGNWVFGKRINWID